MKVVSRALSLLFGRRAEIQLLRELIMNINDIRDQVKNVLAAARANTDKLASIKTVVDGLKSQVADLTAKLEKGADDPAVVAEVTEGLKALQTEMDSQAAAEAALANTDAAPAAPADAPAAS